LLHALGADRETILADYLLSASNAPVTGDPRLEKLTHVLREMTSVNVGPDAIRALLDTREIYLQEALNEVNSEWGGLDGYLHALDFDTAARDRLRDHWLE
ncbi:MAG: tyrosine-protein phosphatase, partial [Pseudomonadota bacterium]|nr:tyrosine-protein phosphatase [Pseudomonadota bacterium]